MKLEELNTSNFFFDPKKTNFVEKMEEIDEFKLKSINGISKRSLLTYITLMCDPESEIRQLHTHYGSRKRESALCAGIKINKNNRFNEEFENLCIGANEKFNAAIVKYLSLTYDAAFIRYNVFQQLQNIALQNALSGEKGAAELADKITEKLRKEEIFIFGGEEVNQMRKSLYEGAAKKDPGLRPEQIAKRIAEGDEFDDFKPYPTRYKEKSTNMHFIGDEPSIEDKLPIDEDEEREV